MMQDLNKFSDELPKEKTIGPRLLALRYCLINVFGSYLSIIVAGIVIMYNTVTMPELRVLIKNGEVIIISISLILTCVYTLYENLKAENIWVHIFFWLSILLLIISIIVYVSIVEKQIQPTLDKEIEDKRFLIVKYFSLIIFLWSIISVYYSQVVSYKKPNSLLSSRNEDMQKLKQQIQTIKE